MDKLLERVGLPALDLQGSQTLYFREVLAAFQGTGLRSLLPVLAALTDDWMRVILIDEPEMSLEPALAKKVRDLLIEEASDRAIVVATHSHLFINKADVASNMTVDHDQGPVRTVRLRARGELSNLVFSLLGNATEDLLLPANFLVVEGSSDQVIADRVLELLGAPVGRVKVFAGRGIDDVPQALAAVQTVRPLIAGEGPYARTVVALVDEPANGAQRNRVNDLRKRMPERLFVLSERSLEEYLPEHLYKRAKLVKAAELARLKRQSRDHVALRESKTSIARAIARVLRKRDLGGIPIIRDAVAKSIELAG